MPLIISDENQLVDSVQYKANVELMLNSKSVFFLIIASFLLGSTAEKYIIKNLGQNAETWALVMRAPIILKQLERLSITTPSSLDKSLNLEKKFYSLMFSIHFQEHKRFFCHLLDNIAAARINTDRATKEGKKDDAADAHGAWYSHFIRNPALVKLAISPGAPQKFQEKYKDYRDNAYTLFSRLAITTNSTISRAQKINGVGVN